MIVAALILGCTPATDERPYRVPNGATAYWYTPEEELTTFPDDYQTIAADTATGRSGRGNPDPGRA